MSSAIFPDAGFKTIMDLLATVLPASPADAQIHLFASSSLTIGESTTLADLAAAECTFGGYAAIALPSATSVTQDPYTTVAAFPLVTWTASGSGLPQTAYGFWVDAIDPLTSERALCWVGNFSTPQVVAAPGDTINLLLSLSDCNCVTPPGPPAPSAYYGITLNGSSGYLDFGDHVQLQLTTTGTISFWFFFPTGGIDTDGLMLLSRGGTGGEGLTSAQCYIQAGQLGFDVSNNGTSSLINPLVSYTKNQWNNVVFTWNASGWQLYLNAVEVASGADVVNFFQPSGTAGHWLGGAFYLASGEPTYFSGTLDAFRWYPGWSNSTTIAAYYAGGYGNPTSDGSPVGWYRLDEGSGTTLVDSSIYGAAGVLTGGGTYVSSPVQG